MRLKSLSYQDYQWELDNLQLGETNLIVGKNATGKSRVLAFIDLLVKMITQKRDLNWGGIWDATFENEEGQEIDYHFKTSTFKQGVTSELITVDGVSKLNRTSDDQAILSSHKNEGKEVREIYYPPFNKLTLHVRRDVREYPYFEEIVSWAENSYGFKFGNISPLARQNEQEYDLLTAVEDIPILLKSLKSSTRHQIVEDFNSIGYQISSISLRDRGDGMPLIFIKENDIDKPMPHYKLSQGMFRSLAVIIFIDYLIANKKPATIIIDDLGEGLDYDRATKLGKLVFKKCADNGIQLIATSNDSFLMDVVDIENWNVLHRNGKTVHCLNNRNHPELIEKFRFTGLSNFDFFSSNFLAKQKVW